MSESQHIDQQALAELKDIMEADFQLLIDTFLEDSRKRIEVLEKAVAAGDANTIREYAHSFKGSSSNICAPTLADLCKDMEYSGRDGCLDGTATMLENIKTEFAIVESALTSL